MIEIISAIDKRLLEQRIDTMISPSYKIQVFISSACGDEPEMQKYNVARKALKVLIESTGFAEVYLFEPEGASTFSAEQGFLFALEKSDVCLFLIDNADGVPQGVQKEIDCAKKHAIKSLFYFCDQSSREETPLEKSLKNPNNAKISKIHSFSDIIYRGASDLINDITEVYRRYCGKYILPRDDLDSEQSSNAFDVVQFAYSDNVTAKDVLANIDCCVGYFTNQFFKSFHNEEKKTGELDRLCSRLLQTLFEGVVFDKDNYSALLAEIENHQTTELFAVTKIRYEALEAFYSGNHDTCISKLKDALQTAKRNRVPEWLQKDILIDLRNQDTFLKESRNEVFPVSEYQDELESGQTPLYYPFLDRLDSRYYEGIIKETIRDKMQTPGTISFGSGLVEQVKSLASIYVLSMYFGSLSHIRLLYKRLKYIAFYFSSRYSDWHLKMLLLKMVLIDGTRREINGVLECFGDLRSKMNDREASEIYTFTVSSVIQHHRLNVKLEAFRIVGYYMDDKAFDLAWTELYGLILQWIEDEDSAIVAGGSIFAALEANCVRISQNQLVEIVCKSIEHKKHMIYDAAFHLIYNCIDLADVSPDNAANLLDKVIYVVRNADQRAYIHSLETALFTLRKRNKNLTNELDGVIADEMPDFYRDSYLLETSANEAIDMPLFIEQYIAQAISDNENQGKNGAYSGPGRYPHTTILNILQQSNVVFSVSLLDAAFGVVCDTLLNDRQTINTKLEAMDLIVFLIKSYPGIKDRNTGVIKKLLGNRTEVEKAHAVMTDLDDTSLRFSALFLYQCLGENIIVRLLATLADIRDDASTNQKASETVLSFLETDHSPLSDIQLEYILLQRAIEWTVSADLHTRVNAAKILFSLLRNKDNGNIICNQLVRLMDNDDVHIKYYILENVSKIKEIDIESYKYIIQKGKLDTNYVVRMLANKTQDLEETTISDILRSGQ